MRIDFVFFDAGSGHRSAAESLREVIATGHPDWQVRLVHLQELFDPIDPLLRFTGVRMQDHYNKMLSTGMTLGAGAALPLIHGIERVLSRYGAPILEKFWRDSPVDLVVSLIPNFNRTVYAGVRSALPHVPFVTLLTDMADYPPHFWIEAIQDPRGPEQHGPEQHFICGTGRAVAQAIELGHPLARIHRTSGMVVHPRFYEPPQYDRATERKRLGLDPARATGLVLFGGHGSMKVLDIAKRIDDTGLDVQLILVCGKNEKLERRMRDAQFRMKVFIAGFSREVPRFMRAADFFIGKPGPGSISEALVMNLPVIVERNAWTLPQERYNAQWVTETGTGLVLRNFSEIGEAVKTLLHREDEFRKNAAALSNQAVFEVPGILERIVAGNAARAGNGTIQAPTPNTATMQARR